MKKFLSFFLVFSMMVFGVLGCGAGGGGGGSLGGSTGTVVAAVALFTLAILATGGAAAPVAFAASVKEKPRAGIFSQVSITENKISVRVTPYKNGVAYGTPVTVKSSSISYDSSGNLKCTATLEPVSNQYLVEVIANSAALSGQQTLLKGHVYSSSGIKNGDVVPATIDPTSTAYAMVYESWAPKVTETERVYSTFETKAQAKATSFSSLTTNVQKAFSSKAALMSSGSMTSPGTGTATTTGTTTTTGPTSTTGTGHTGTAAAPTSASPTGASSGGTTTSSAPSDSSLTQEASSLAGLL